MFGRSRLTVSLARAWRSETIHRGRQQSTLTTPFVYPHSEKVAKYGNRFSVALIPGDGVGPELTDYVKDIFSWDGVPVNFEPVTLNSHNCSDVDVEEALLAVKRTGVALKGNIESLIHVPGFKSLNAVLRSELDLFASVVRCQSLPGVRTRHSDINIAIIRQNTEGEYKNLEHENIPGVVEMLKVITRAKSERIARFAFEYAKRNKRKKVTCVHKANIMKLSDGLFLETCLKMSSQYPDIQFENVIVDNCCMQMVSRPQQFDVMVMPNLYGNIVSNVAAGLIGGPGMTSGKNYGTDYAIFETGTRNSGKSLVGQNRANPTAMLFAAADMLIHLGLKEHGKRLNKAIYRTLMDTVNHTPDIGGTATTSDVITAVKKHM